MTAILAVPHGRKVYVAADRGITDGNGAAWVCSPKVVRLGEYVFALAGAVGGDWDALKATCPDPRSPSDILSAVGPGPDAMALIAFGGQVVLAQWDASARWGCCRVYGAIGIGQGGPWAEGAYLAQPRSVSVRDRVLRALAISAERCSSVRGPFDLVTT